MVGAEGGRKMNPSRTYGKATARRFTFYNAEQLGDFEPMTWRVDDLLPTSGLACLFGPSAVGKSFLLLDLVAAIAEGRPWFGHQTTACKILCMVLEGEAGFRKRVSAWSNFHAKPFPENVLFSFDTLALTSEEDVSELLLAIGKAGRFDMVVIDTLNRAAPNADENSSQHMNQLLGAATELQSAINGLVVLVHHTGKDHSRGMRGHSSLFAAMDSVIEITNASHKKIWKLCKSKDGEEGLACSFDLEKVILPGERSGKEVTSCVVIPSDATPCASSVPKPRADRQQLVLDVIQSMLDDSTELGKGGAPDSSPCITIKAAVESTRHLLDVEPRRRSERAKQTIKQLSVSGFVKMSDEWLWKS